MRAAPLLRNGHRGQPYSFATPRWFEGVLHVHGPESAGDRLAGRLELCVPEARYDHAGRRRMGEQLLLLAPDCSIDRQDAAAPSSALELDGQRAVGRNWKQGGCVDMVIILSPHPRRLR
jgi:hypothetical protein